MAEVIGVGHQVGHAGIGLDCPVSCLGVQTVGDLLRLLVQAGQTSGMHAQFAERLAGGQHEHEQVTAGCPLACLGLSARVVNALRSDRGRAQTVGDVLVLLRSQQLAEVRNIGPRGIGEVRAALVAAGFQVPQRFL